MSLDSSPATAPGLRERKKRRTRETIEQTALELFDAQGYDETTLADIARAADVAPRTLFAYFASKEDILFRGESEFYDRLEHALHQRPAHETTIDALRTFLTSGGRADAKARLRQRIIAASDDLGASKRARSATVERILAVSIARDLGADPGDVRPELVAAAMTVAFNAARDRRRAGSSRALSHQETVALLDITLTFARGGLDAIKRAT